jgi:Uma2 family endonuclease
VIATAEQYLHTSFEHDPEFVEGRIVERPAPTWEHSCIQGYLIVTTTPYLCVEILSPEDATSETLEKVREYLLFGVKWVWMIDPVTHAGQVHTPGQVTAVDNQIFFTDRFEVDLTAAEF